DRVDVDDRISRTRLVTRYGYHHGYFDGVEREFRGFGMVEQWDSEAFAALADDPGADIDGASTLPPMLTRSWFHTGAFVQGARVSLQFRQAYWQGPRPP